MSRIDILQRIVDHGLTCTAAAPLLGLSQRHVHRLVSAYRTQGASGLISKRRGKPSNRGYPAALRNTVLELAREHYADCGATFVAKKLAEHHGVRVSHETVRRWMIGSGLFSGNTRDQAKRAAFEWMRAVLQKRISDEELRRDSGDLAELARLLHYLYGAHLFSRNRSMVILAKNHGLARSVICDFLSISPRTFQTYWRAFEHGGTAELFSRRIMPARKVGNNEVKEAVFSLLHEPPGNYGINRTSWKMADLCRILREKGQPVSAEVVRKITRAAGYRWRKARVVLTSNDPAYSDKLGRIRTILSSLRPDEAFFSIDEYGPFAVKAKPGLTLTAPGEQRTVPQWQKSRGCLLMTAALELSGNQVTHFYSAGKNTAEMIRMMEVLVDQYRDRKKLYLSWDGASWHISKRLLKRIEEHNAAVQSGQGPIIETALLPTGAQFLNVIESVFSGMARAIIHNSDYKSVDDAKAAIDRYLEERNAHFRQHPRRAGNKIWRMEREPATFSEANNCKDPRYR
ncbi:IS630 family transposase [Microvirga yunnanensis]|uniref:IS630 family transposase n=1 Tax=Microvirga yunnanensis TaxID=2953740 RepID=UPI0021C85557|nr:IS630 family transposase [Microvirga sp. HBU65207]